MANKFVQLMTVSSGLRPPLTATTDKGVRGAHEKVSNYTLGPAFK